MAELKVGDRVRVKSRPDWWLPTKYKLENVEGMVAEVLEEEENLYIAVELDEALIGMDKRIRVGFRVEDVEKI